MRKKISTGPFQFHMLNDRIFFATTVHSHITLYNSYVCVCVSVLFIEEHGFVPMTVPMNTSFRSSAHSLLPYILLKSC